MADTDPKQIMRPLIDYMFDYGFDYGFELRRFKWDKWNNLLGSRIPNGAKVEIVRFYPRRRVLVKHDGHLINTMLWCVPKTAQNTNSEGEQ